MPHVIRSHLYYGINCPVLGDPKYTKPKQEGVDYEPVRLSDACLNLLGLKKNWGKKLPMYMHLAEVQIPDGLGGKPLTIRADMPHFFAYTLRKLLLLRHR
jgi:23S rRNA-/tRNA-specific pseudouridylate synthase